MRLRTIFALALLLAVSPRTSVRAQDDDDAYDAPSGDEGAPPPPDGDEGTPPPDEDTYRDAPDPDDYDEALAPNGEWVEDPSYGRVWHPSVAADWRPYTDGYWAWTPYGWTWISSEPWGWTFHYGHWALAGPGWVWIPGTVWGPAYVDWVWGEGYIGWAPLAPVGHVVVVNNFVFVNEHHFCNPRINTVIVRHAPGGFGHGDWHRFRVRSPELHRVERIAREPVHRVQGKPPGTLAPRRGGFNRAPGLRTPDGRPQGGQQDHPNRNRQGQPQGNRKDQPRGNGQERPQRDRPDRPQRNQPDRPQAGQPDGSQWRGGHPDAPPPRLRGEEQQRPDGQRDEPRSARPKGPGVGEGHERGGQHREGHGHANGSPQGQRD
jgi:hypothetical protein